MSRLDINAVRQRWSARGFSCDVWQDAPGQMWADFVHPSDELVLLVEGELEITFGGRTLAAPIGEEVLIPAHTPHSVRNTGQRPNCWL